MNVLIDVEMIIAQSIMLSEILKDCMILDAIIIIILIIFATPIHNWHERQFLNRWQLNTLDHRDQCLSIYVEFHRILNPDIIVCMIMEIILAINYGILLGK